MKHITLLNNILFSQFWQQTWFLNKVIAGWCHIIPVYQPMHVLVLRGWLSSYGTEESKFLPFHGSQDLRYSKTVLKREKREWREPISFSFLNIFSKLKKKERKKEAFVHELIRQWEWLGKEGRLTEVWRRSCPIPPSWASVSLNWLSTCLSSPQEERKEPVFHLSSLLAMLIASQ